MPLKAFIQILRPVNCLIACLGVWVGYCLALGRIAFTGEAAFAMVPVFLICGAGQAVNDYFDLEVDRKAGKRLILPSGKMRPRTALHYSLLLFILGTFAAYHINLTAFAIAAAFSVLLFAYSAFLSRWKFLGNWVVAAGTAFTLIFGAAVAGSYELPMVLAFAALLANASREITKDAEDIRGDEGVKKSLPQLLSFNSLKVLQVLLTAAAVTTGFLPLLAGVFTSPGYIALMALSAVAFSLSLALFFGADFQRSQRWSKAGMVLALLAFLGGVLG